MPSGPRRIVRLATAASDSMHSSGPALSRMLWQLVVAGFCARNNSRQTQASCWSGIIGMRQRLDIARAKEEVKMAAIYCLWGFVHGLVGSVLAYT